jgi:hypothetical protein
MSRRRGHVFALLSLAATAGVPVLFLLVRLRRFTFRDDFTGLNAVGFFITWALALLLAGAVMGALAWHADRRSWLVRSAVGVNGVLLAGVLWLLVALGGWW